MRVTEVGAQATTDQQYGWLHRRSHSVFRLKS